MEGDLLKTGDYRVMYKFIIRFIVVLNLSYIAENGINPFPLLAQENDRNCTASIISDDLIPNIDYVAGEVVILLFEENKSEGEALLNASRLEMIETGLAELDSVNAILGLKKITASPVKPLNKFTFLFPKSADINVIIRAYCHFSFIRAISANTIGHTPTAVKLYGWSWIKKKTEAIRNETIYYYPNDSIIHDYISDGTKKQ